MSPGMRLRLCGLAVLAGIATLLASANLAGSSYAVFNDVSSGAQPVGSGAWQPGTITIILETTPAAASSASFTFSDTVLAPCAIGVLDTDSATTEVPDQRTCTDVPIGSYSVTQALPAGWTFMSVQCTESGDQNSSVDTATRTANIVVDAGESVECRFQNLQTTLSLVATHDAWVDSGSPATNHGSAATMDVTNVTVAVIQYFNHSFLRFDLSTIPLGSTINGATLRVCHGGGLLQLRSHQLQPVGDSPWQEGTLTWNNRPTTFAGTPIGWNVPLLAPPQCVSSDVTGHVQMWADGTPNWGWRISQPAVLSLLSLSSVSYGTSEGPADTRPILDIQFTPPATIGEFLSQSSGLPEMVAPMSVPEEPVLEASPIDSPTPFLGTEADSLAPDVTPETAPQSPDTDPTETATPVTSGPEAPDVGSTPQVTEIFPTSTASPTQTATPAP